MASFTLMSLPQLYNTTVLNQYLIKMYGLDLKINPSLISMPSVCCAGLLEAKHWELQKNLGKDSVVASLQDGPE